MKVSIQTYTLVILLFATTTLFGQSKDCGNPVYYSETHGTKCYIIPAKTIGDTIVSYIPKNCNQISFDTTANGHWKIFSADTVLLEILSFKNGLRNGEYISYYKNGQIKAKLNYVNGKLFGREILYSETGKITEEGNYDINESFIGTTTQYWDNGVKASEHIMKSNIFNGQKKYWDNKGKIICEKAFNKLWYICK